jgi:divalent metal cation (Fe/Co/Zn/Cd) transporter
MTAVSVGAAAGDVLARRVRRLVGATIGYNLLEAGVALAAGAAASSTALLGFGMDSLVEVSSAAAVAWQFAARTAALRAARERAALRVVAGSFFALAALVTADGIRSLTGASEARPSTAGLVLAAVSLVVMPILSAAQRRAGRQMGSTSAVSDSKQTLLCTYLSAVLLVGLAANSLLGWSWADPGAGLIIAAVAVREGVQAWRGEACCAAPTAPGTVQTPSPVCTCGHCA